MYKKTWICDTYDSTFAFNEFPRNSFGNSRVKINTGGFELCNEGQHADLSCFARSCCWVVIFRQGFTFFTWKIYLGSLDLAKFRCSKATHPMSSIPLTFIIILLWFQTVELYGNGSSDDHGIVSYEWKIVSDDHLPGMITVTQFHSAHFFTPLLPCKTTPDLLTCSS